MNRSKDKNELFAERITALRKESGKKQKEVAVSLGFTVGTLSTYENGREPRYEYLNKLADYYGVTVDYLTGNNNYKSMTIEKINKLSMLINKFNLKLTEELK